MNEQYQKVAYIGLRRKDGSYAVNIPLYVKLDEVDKKDMDESREEIIHKVTEIMMRRYEKQLAESFVKIRILIRRLHFLFDGRVVFYFHKFADHCVGRNIKQPMKMQSLFIRGAFPNADVFPFATVTHFFERIG